MDTDGPKRKPRGQRTRRRPAYDRRARRAHRSEPGHPPDVGDPARIPAAAAAGERPPPVHRGRRRGTGWSGTGTPASGSSWRSSAPWPTPNRRRPRSTPSCAGDTPTSVSTGCASRRCWRSRGRSRTSSAPRPTGQRLRCLPARALLPVRRAPMVRDRPGLEVPQPSSPTSRRATQRRAGPVTLPADAPMRREWAVVCDAPDLPVVLTAWELPGQNDVPDRHGSSSRCGASTGRRCTTLPGCARRWPSTQGAGHGAEAATDGGTDRARPPRSDGALQPNGGLRRPPRWVTDQRTTRKPQPRTHPRGAGSLQRDLPTSEEKRMDSSSEADPPIVRLDPRCSRTPRPSTRRCTPWSHTSARCSGPVIAARCCVATGSGTPSTRC